MKGTDGQRLARSYRRLLRAYPRWYRRERGEELLTTLLDAAPPGRCRPAGADVVDLIGGALRARLRPPRGIGPYGVAVIVALYVAVAGAAGAVWLSPYPGPPSDAEAVAAAVAAVGREPVNVPGPPVHCDILCPEEHGRDEVVAYDAPADRTDRVVVSYDVPAEEAAMLVTQAHERLAAARWDVDDMQVQSDGIRVVDAVKGGLEISLASWPASSGPGGASLTVVVAKGWSTTAVAALVAGFLGGLAVGWLTVVWVLQRQRRQHPAVAAVMVLVAVPALAVTGGAVCLAALMAVGAGVIGPNPKDVQVPIFALTALPVVTVALGVASLVTLGLAALPAGWRRPPSTARRATGEPA